MRGQRFFAGKFDQWKRDIPYSTIVQAFTEVVLEILAGSQERIATWRELIQGPGRQRPADRGGDPPGRAGDRPAARRVLALPPTESQNRFRTAFRRFIGVFAAEQHPLALFPDDLHDLASLALIQDLLTHSETRHMFVVGAYRDNEVTTIPDPGPERDPQGRRPGDGGAAGPAVQPAPGGFFGDVLHRGVEDGAPLARLVEEKTPVATPSSPSSS